MKYLYLAAAILLAGCDYKATVSPESASKKITCVDTRDGEKFTFKAASVTDAKIGQDPSFTVVDDSGTKRTLRQSMEQFLKCSEVKP